ncbi:MAG: glycosyltransferase family 39 protein [Vicinamibacterales bacterium]
MWRLGGLPLALTIAAAFALRVAARMWLTDAPYDESGYSFYLQIARTWLDGGGLCREPSVQCAQRMPLYPVWLAPFVAADWVYPGVVLAQAAVGAGAAWLAWAIGNELFDSRAGLVAAGLTAANPYAVVHDTALQDTCLLNALVALAVLLVLRLRHRASSGLAIGAGLALALAVLTTARVALLLPVAVSWIAFAGGKTRSSRVRHAIITGATAMTLVGGWMVRNAFVVGAPVLTTETGLSLWVANNDWTFAHFPERSIDLSTVESYRQLPGPQLDALRSVEANAVARDRLQASWAVAWALAEPRRMAERVVRKLWVVVSAELSPARTRLVQVGYLLLFVPVHVLAMVGLWQSRHEWHSHAILYAVFATFALTTAIFWAHTSHKSHLDAFLFVYSAGAVRSTRLFS